MESAPESNKIEIALSISSFEEAPVDRITGFDLDPTFLKKGKLFISAEAILKKGTNSFRKSTDL